jgi:hypothetical protein
MVQSRKPINGGGLEVKVGETHGLASVKDQAVVSRVRCHR